MFKQNITLEEVNLLPAGSFDGKIVVVQNSSILDYAVEMLNKETIIGFDTETKPCFKKGKANRNSVALLQLASTDCVFLFRLKYTGLPDSLKGILSNRNILKIGLAVRDDIKALQKLSPFNPEAFLDLADVANNYGIEERGLKKISAITLGIRISKSQRLSNWENEELSPSQQVYAATDAWACNIIYRKLLISQ
ncbi:MAG: hypothetical protein A2W91_11160 [Bacteroidetes bacterium GWF2_38_335]|nr:MAG: hypothetical protein A2W91_11160 [Bacteroidetes bacterium GWF2_38_335]OFY81916.1 MAG: hypothetical protein A2281_05880 [Bacteroidetes bacterium RIFOXYA12_FULL_38_20]HBS87809.1 hypothetical protein [Bacteroidales bacterium]